MSFGNIGRTGLGIRQVWLSEGLGIGPRQGVLLGANFGRAIVTNVDFTAYVCDSAATRPSSQITLGRLVLFCSLPLFSFVSGAIQIHFVIAIVKKRASNSILSRGVGSNWWRWCFTVLPSPLLPFLPSAFLWKRKRTWYTLGCQKDRKPLVAITLSILKCVFYSRSIKI